jgi:predicted Rossmann fold flavoprotein
MKDIVWDVVVVGGGPAGMMAAISASQKGAKVMLIEKNTTLGKKLLITGGGRCNVTNAEFDDRKLLAKFRGQGKFLFSSFDKWNVEKSLEFFHTRNMPTKIENEKRVFPISDSAQSVWDVLVTEMHKNKVTILSDSPVTGIILSDDKKSAVGVTLKNKTQVLGKSVIIATGGTSRPETGSTGDGYKWLAKIGHTISEPTASLVPIAVKDKWVKALAGVSLKDIKISLFQNDALQEKVLGKVLFTHVGVSGPTILNMSKSIGELLKYGAVVISLDILPSLNYGDLNLKLQEIFNKNPTKKFKNVLGELAPGAMTGVIVELSGINPDIICNAVSREQRLGLVKLFKGIPLHVDKLLGLDKAVISSGGVDLREVDFKTCASRLYPNLYLVGDILNIDRPSGGYSLQLCWTTGYVAGTSAAEN